MKTLTLTAALITLASSAPARGAEFKIMKPGEWRSELVQSSMGPAAKFIKPQTLCIAEADNKRDWESVLKDEFQKSQMDCKLDKLKQDKDAVSYQIHCRGSEAGKGQKNSLPPDAKYQGTVTVSRESETSYIMDSDSKVSGLTLSDADLSKIPAEQRKALAAVLAMQTGDLKVKMKHRYTFVKTGCVKKSSTPVKASVETIRPESEKAPALPGKK